MKPNQNNDSQFDIFKTGTTISEAPSWFDSLLKQIVERREERKHPRPQIHITAAKDPTALNKLVDMPSPVTSLFSDIREAVNDYLHPRKIETTAQLVEVEEIWSKPPQPLSVFGRGSVVFAALLGLALIPWATSIPALPKANETAVVVYTPVNLVMPLKPDARDSGGGGGGGRKTLTPPSLGKLPRAADKQFVPPDPEPPKNPDPKLIVEPTVVAPQLANLPQINLLNIGDPNGVPGPPSAGPGVGGGIGTGQGRGIGEGKGPGVGPGEGGGTGGGVFRVGGSAGAMENHGNQQLGLNGLGDDFEFVAALLSFPQNVSGGGLSGKQDDTALRQKLPDANAKLDAVPPRHDHIADDDVRPESLNSFERRFAVASGERLEAFPGQDFDQSFGDGGFVVNNKHFQIICLAGLAIMAAGFVELLRRGVVGPQQYAIWRQ